VEIGKYKERRKVVKEQEKGQQGVQSALLGGNCPVALCLTSAIRIRINQTHCSVCATRAKPPSMVRWREGGEKGRRQRVFLS